MIFSVRLSVEEEAVLKRAAAVIGVSRSEFVRRSAGMHARQVLQAEDSAARIDAMYIGAGGGLRRRSMPDDSAKQAIQMRLLRKHGL